MTRPAVSADPRPFDPTAGFFIAMDQRPPGLGSVDPATLEPFQRALLTVDGTVTQFIESFALEPVTIEVLDHAADEARDAAPWLACDKTAEVLRRRSALVGGVSGELYAYAESVLLPPRLPADMRAALYQESGGLGKILLKAALETRREGLWFGKQQLDELPCALTSRRFLTVLTRTYRVIAGGAPLMLITEHFPLGGVHGA